MASSGACALDQGRAAEAQHPQAGRATKIVSLILKRSYEQPAHCTQADTEIFHVSRSEPSIVGLPRQYENPFFSLDLDDIPRLQSHKLRHKKPKDDVMLAPQELSSFPFDISQPTPLLPLLWKG